MIRPDSTARASALLLALWCVAVLSISILAVASMVASDVEDAGLQNRRFEARQLALTGVAYGLNPRIEVWEPLLDQRFPDGSSLRVTVTSEAARIDINRALREKDQRTLRELFRQWNVRSEAVSAAVDSLVDWADGDEFRSLNGAERGDLAGQGRYSPPANRDFRSVGEMEKVRGMDLVAAANPNWASSFTVYGGRRLDLQEASVDVLRAAGGLTSEQARQVELARNGPDRLPHTRDDVKIKNVPEFLQRIGIPEPQAKLVAARFAAGAGPTRVESRGTVGGTSYTVVAIASRGSGNGGEVSLLSWEEK